MPNNTIHQMGRAVGFETFSWFEGLIAFYRGPFIQPTGDGGRVAQGHDGYAPMRAI